MSSLREDATKLRKQGSSYRKIANSLNIPKSTLSYWFSNKKWSDKVKNTNTLKSRKDNSNRMHKLSMIAKKNREDLYHKMREQAGRSFRDNCKDTLFIAGLMIYWTEGDNMLENGQIRVANSDVMMLRYYYLFLQKYFVDVIDKVRMYLVLYPDLNDNKCKKYWSNEVGISLDRFYKSQYIIGHSKKRILKYGTATVIISNRAYKEKIIKWIDLYKEKIKEMR